jgi:hypothetical protein
MLKQCLGLNLGGGLGIGMRLGFGLGLGGSLCLGLILGIGVVDETKAKNCCTKI